MSSIKKGLFQESDSIYNHVHGSKMMAPFGKTINPFGYLLTVGMFDQNSLTARNPFFMVEKNRQADSSDGDNMQHPKIDSWPLLLLTRTAHHSVTICSIERFGFATLDLCKPTHFFIKVFIPTIFKSLQTSFISVLIYYSDINHLSGNPARSSSGSK